MHDKLLEFLRLNESDAEGKPDAMFSELKYEHFRLYILFENARHGFQNADHLLFRDKRLAIYKKPGALIAHPQFSSAAHSAKPLSPMTLAAISAFKVS